MRSCAALRAVVLVLPCAGLATAGDVRVTLEATVFAANPSPSSGPFAGIAAGDSVTLAVEVFVPGTVISPNQYVSHLIDTAASSLTIGGATTALSGGTLNFQDAFPVADGIRIFSAPLVGGGSLTCELGEQTGTMFSSIDIAQNLGTWPGSIFGSYNLMLVGNGGFVEFSPDRLTISLPEIGAAYCAPINPNSTGVTGEIAASGSLVAADNDVTLSARRLPLNSFGFFICSRTQGYVIQSPGFAGVLCLGGAIGRYVGPGQVKNSGAVGAFSLAIDLTQTPTPTGLVPAMAGDTWNFQAWHRDSVGGMAVSNFTNGVELVFL